MTLSLYILLTIVILTLVGIAAFRQHRREQNLASGWQNVDLKAFARLLDKSDDDFLARHLHRFVVVKLRFQRALVAEDYLAGLNANAEYAIAIARLNPDQDDLFLAATALRMEVARLRWKIWLAVLWPASADVQKLDLLARFFDEKRLSIASVARPIH